MVIIYLFATLQSFNLRSDKFVLGIDLIVEVDVDDEDLVLELIETFHVESRHLLRELISGSGERKPHHRFEKSRPPNYPATKS